MSNKQTLKSVPQPKDEINVKTCSTTAESFPPMPGSV